MNGINHYVKGLIDGLESPFFAPVHAKITNNISLPDQFTSADIGGQMLPVPFCFLWSSNTAKKRQTAPRPAAWSARRYIMQILLVVVDSVEAANRESAFNCLCDAVDIALSTTMMPLPIIDPDTQWPSQVVSIGEEETTEVFLPETVGDEVGSFLRYSYRCSHVIEERQNYALWPTP